MSSNSRRRRWYVLVPFTLFAILLWDVTVSLLNAEKVAREQFQRGFEVDASRREGMRDLLGRDVQTALMYALHNVSSADSLATDAERTDRLMSSFEQLGFMLRNSRYDFVSIFLTERAPDGELRLRGRYPRPINLVDFDPSQTPLFANLDLDNMDLYEQHDEVHFVDPGPLMTVSTRQPAMIGTRLIVKGENTSSDWYISILVGFADIHNSIDLIGQQMAGGVTPMRVVSLDARTNACQIVWEVGIGVVDCDDAYLDAPIAYRTQYNAAPTRALTYSLYQPTDAYLSFRSAPDKKWRAWLPFLPAFLAFLLLITTIRFMRYWSQSEGLMESFTRSLSDKDSLNTSIHEVLSSHLEAMSRFTYAMRRTDVQAEERRYFDIAISEFLEASLSLNTLILERPLSGLDDKAITPTIDLTELRELAQMALDVATVDTSVETKIFVPDNFPSEIKGYGYSAQTAVISAISLSAQLTEDGRIEVSLWVDSEDTDPCLYLRVNDSGIGWGDLSDDTDSMTSTEDNIARRALCSCLKFSGVTLETQSESELGNEYLLKLCDGK